MQARCQLMQIKGLDQIVIRPGLQAFNALAHGITGRQHQHRHLHALLAPARQQVQAVLIGQTQIQHTDVEVRRLDGSIGLRGAAHHIHTEALQLQARLDPTGHQSVIFYQQHVHCLTPELVLTPALMPRTSHCSISCSKNGQHGRFMFLQR